MQPLQIITAVVFACTGLLFIGLAQPLIKRRIPPNQFYGFRLPDAFSSETVWYAVNEYAARLLRMLGVIVLAAIPVLQYLALPEPFFALSMAAIVLVGTAAVIVRSYRYLQQLMKQ
jgi:uncharacterized membrane protein